MKKKNRIFLFAFIFFIVLLLFIFLFFFLKKEEEKPVDVKIPYGPVEVFTLPYDHVASYVDGYFLVNKGNQSILLKEEDRRELQTFPVLSHYLQVFYDSYFLLKDTSTYYLYNANGEEILSSTNSIVVLQDKVTQEYYFYNQETLYNASLEPVYQTKDIEVVIINQEIYADHKIYSLESHKQLGTYKNSFLSGSAFVLELNKGLKVYFPSENKWDSFTRYEIQFERIFFYQEDSVISVSNDGTVYEGENATRIEVEAGYYIDASTCEVGGVLKNAKDETVYAGCGLFYDTKYLDKGLYSVGDKDEITVYLLDGRALRNATIEGDYLFAFDDKTEENIIYTTELEKKDVPLCEGLYSLRKLDSKHYVCSTGEGDIILDNTLQEKKYQYDAIDILSNGVAIVKKENQYGFFANEELYMDLQPYYDGKFFTNLDYSTSYIVFSQMFRSVVIKNTNTDVLLKKEELSYKSESYGEDVSVEEMVSKYHLESIKKEILNQEDFFKKFAYIVETNDKLGDYKNYVMDSFIVLCDYTDLLSEEKFLYHLKQLSMKKVDYLNVSGAVGLYEDSSKAITFIEDSPRVLYHEIMHFIDYNLEDKPSSFSYYLCSDNKLLDYQKYLALEKEEKNMCQPYYGIYNANFLVEAGAEVLMAEYFHHDVTVVYYHPVVVYEALSYLMGAEAMHKIYLEHDSTHALYQELVVQKGMDYEAFSKALQSFNSTVQTTSFDNLIDIADSLVAIYSLYKEGNWYEDKEFLLLLSMLVKVDAGNISSPNANLYKQYIFSITTLTDSLFEKKEEFATYSLRTDAIRLVVTKEGIKYVMDIWNKGEEGSLVFTLDLETGDIMDYQYYAF